MGRGLGAKSMISEKVLKATNRYEKDDTSEKGQPNIINKSKDEEDQITTTYKVNTTSGKMTQTVGQPVRTIEPTVTTTVYTVNPKTGEITEEVIDKLIASNGNGIKPPVVENNDFNGGVNGDADGSSLVNEKPDFDLLTLKNADLRTGLNDFVLNKDSTKDDVKFILVNDTKPSTSIKRSEKPSSEKPVSQLPNTAGGDNMAINALGALTLASVLGLAATKRTKEEN